jgi:hypothetical protein
MMNMNGCGIARGLFFKVGILGYVTSNGWMTANDEF